MRIFGYILLFFILSLWVAVAYPDSSYGALLNSLLENLGISNLAVLLNPYVQQVQDSIQEILQSINPKSK